MKKLVILLLSFLVAASFAACDERTGKKTEEKDPGTATETITKEETETATVTETATETETKPETVTKEEEAPAEGEDIPSDLEPSDGVMSNQDILEEEPVDEPVEEPSEEDSEPVEEEIS